MDGVVSPIDYVAAGGIWALAFSGTLTLYFLSRSIGAFIEMLRRG